MEDLREEISEILVRWHMPTRQVAIDEIITLIQSHNEAVKRETRKQVTEEIAEIMINSFTNDYVTKKDFYTVLRQSHSEKTVEK